MHFWDCWNGPRHILWSVTVNWRVPKFWRGVALDNWSSQEDPAVTAEDLGPSILAFSPI